MRIASFLYEGREAFGIVGEAGVINAAAHLDLGTLREALAAGALGAVQELEGNVPDFPLSAVRLLPVIPHPDKIICVGVNYATHLKETGREPPSHPMLFQRYPASQVGHGESLHRPPESFQLDFEGELAVVIGKQGRRILTEAALDHVAGYSCYNDGTVRDWQRHTSQFMPGKNFDRTGAFGPWLVTANAIEDPAGLTLQTRVNGRVMQEAPISDLIFDVPALIAYISKFTTLLPGDVIVTGTTGGVGAFRDPPVWLGPGDVVEIEISGIGTLRNTVADEPSGTEA